MPNTVYTDSNNEETKNGYIYKELISRIDRLENQLNELVNLFIDTKGNLTVDSLTDLMKIINTKANKNYVETHVKDMERHLNDIKILDWDSKYELPMEGIPERDLSKPIRDKLNNSASAGYIKYQTTIGNGTDKEFNIDHELDSSLVSVNIKDNVTNEIVFANIKIIDENNIKLVFEKSPTPGQYEILIFR